LTGGATLYHSEHRFSSGKPDIIYGMVSKHAQHLLAPFQACVVIGCISNLAHPTCSNLRKKTGRTKTEKSSFFHGHRWLGHVPCRSSSETSEPKKRRRKTCLGKAT